MTEFIHEAVEEVEHIIEPNPVKVHVTNPGDIVKTERAAPQFSAFNTYQTAGTANDQPIIIGAQDSKRAQILILVQPGAAGNVTGFVLIGSLGQVQNGQGAQLVSGNNPTLQGEGPFYLMSDKAHSLNVTVIDEKYRK